MDRLWTGYGQAVDRLWTGYGQAMDRLWAGTFQGIFQGVDLPMAGGPESVQGKSVLSCCYPISPFHITEHMYVLSGYTLPRACVLRNSAVTYIQCMYPIQYRG